MGSRSRGSRSPRPRRSGSDSSPPGAARRARSPAATARAARSAGCTLFTDRARASTSADCLACHGRGGPAARARACHPVDVDYAAVSRVRSSLRPVGEVVGRGLLLPGHRLHCVTCHDGRSPWAHAVALPPGALPAPAVGAERRRAPGRPPSPPAPGDRVDVRPLCVACHLLG